MKKLLILLVCFNTLLHAQKPIIVTATSKSATVYFNGAEMTHTVAAILPKGSSEIVVKNVADVLNENTVRIGAPSNVTVLSVQFTDNYTGEYEIDENAATIIKVRDSIRLLEKEIAKTNNAKDSEAKAIELLDKNQQISGTSTGLNVTELMKLVEYYKNKRTELSNSYDALEEKTTRLSALVYRLKTKLETNTKKEAKTSKGKLILQVMNETAGNVNFDISYLTSNASWQPFYDLRANSISEPIGMMYKAQVQQNTGIDWKQIKLILSSGNPNQNNQVPLLNPWFLRYGNDKYKEYNHTNSFDDLLQGQAPGLFKNIGYLNETSIADTTVIAENQLSISFDIDIPYDILSNGKAHSVALKEFNLPATYKYYAAPRLEKEAFLLAEISEYSKYNLLKGEANIIFEGMYVGKTFINPNQTSDTLNLSMGTDKKISIKREKIADKSGTRFLSSKKEQTFTYELTIRNNKKEAITLMLKDQYPLSADKEVEIELKQSDNAKINIETGILTWDLDMQPNETKKIRISYKVVYPKNKIIDNL